MAGCMLTSHILPGTRQSLACTLLDRLCGSHAFPGTKAISWTSSCGASDTSDCRALSLSAVVLTLLKLYVVAAVGACCLYSHWPSCAAAQVKSCFWCRTCPCRCRVAAAGLMRWTLTWLPRTAPLRGHRLLQHRRDACLFASSCPPTFVASCKVKGRVLALPFCKACFEVTLVDNICGHRWLTSFFTFPSTTTRLRSISATTWRLSARAPSRVQPFDSGAPCWTWNAVAACSPVLLRASTFCWCQTLC